ncbi:Hypothetical predicted protein [Paramuricea clavata]|uniref:Uncharacterized protein n=1 Tax=Paramuricea clavata TaxID=317549 RepID=A0A7D9ILE1_PARCT|nr:Hypothetical predicted protein [Paramuricea clavata]
MVDEDAETQEDDTDFTSARNSAQTSTSSRNSAQTSTSTRPHLTIGHLGPSREDTTRANSSGLSENAERVLTNLQKEVASLKRAVTTMNDVQQEILACVKKIKMGVESDKFDLANCCHTENIIQLLGKYYSSKGKFPLDFPEKQRALKLEFTGSPTGLTCEELLLRYKKFENAKMSYWRSEERRRLLGIAGYDALLTAPTDVMTDKILHLIGQKHSSGCHKIHLTNEIIVARKYIREITVQRARKQKEFWQGLYAWKTTKWPNGIPQEDWLDIRRDDLACYQEEE